MAEAVPFIQLELLVMREIRTDHVRSAVIRIPVNIFVKDEVYVNPEPVDFGDIAGKTTGPETFLLRKRRGPIQILSVRPDLPFLHVMHAPTDMCNTHEFSVNLHAETLRTGPFSGTIVIRTDDPEFSAIKVRVQGNVRDRR